MVRRSLIRKVSFVLLAAVLLAGLGATSKAGEKRAEDVYFDLSWPYASNSAICSGSAKLYHAFVPNGYTVAVNAGHGTSGGESASTLCHPDGTPKVTGGSTGEGATWATAVSSGMTFLDGTPEAEANLSLARLVRDGLLAKGFDVLMIRDGEDVQLDNVARTVMANQKANAHLALHYDSTEYDKGFFVIDVPDDFSYLSMEPVSSHYLDHRMLGDCLLSGVMNQGIPIYGNGKLALDLTQTSYSTIPSVDVEVGDRASDISYSTQLSLAKGIVSGVCLFFGVAQ
ncbi:MAG: N-acetylmuramoyl-L-alanine amidase [Blautia sp.]|nr:N-acetylmuramoyl-L-alanine amidase [Blautia sp.]